MEALFTIVLMILFTGGLSALVYKFSSPSTTTGGDVDARCPQAHKIASAREGLKLNVHERKEKTADVEFNVFEVNIEGGIMLSRPQNNGVMFSLQLLAIDENKTKWSVFTDLDALTDNDAGRGTFHYKKFLSLPGQISFLEKPVTFLAVPKPVLSFPFKGSFELLFSLTASERNSLNEWSVLFKKECRIPTVSNEYGYKDISRHQEVSRINGIKLATLLSRIDGHADEAEGAVIKKYITQKINRAANASKESVKAQLNDAVREVFSESTASIPAKIDTLCQECADFPVANKLEIIELLLHVTRADDVAKQSEMKLLDQIVKKMCVDFEDYKKLRDKIIQIETYEAGKKGELSTRALLGITDEMDETEIRSVLNKEYRKWNSRQNSADGTIRTQAQKMIQLIAEERARLGTKVK
jgi:hypothetical protein